MKENRIDISFIIPAFNAENFLWDTLNPLNDLSHRMEIQIIFINDGSTDKTLDLMRKFKEESSVHATTIIHRDNRGVSASRNEGFNIAQGLYVLFLDADDVVDLDSIVQNIDILNTDLFLDGIASRSIDFSLDIRASQDIRLGIHSVEQLLSSQAKYSSCPSGYLWRRNFLILNEINFNENLQSSADKLFILECALKGNLRINKKAFFYYRVNENSMSNRISENLLLDKIRYISEFQNIMNEYHLINFSAYLAQQFYTVSGMAYKLNRKLIFYRYFLKALFKSPKTVFHNLF